MSCPASGLHTQRNYADQLLFPDPDSFRVIPWLEKTASVVCLGYEYDGEPQRAAPRWVLSELVAQANALGYDVMIGPRIRILPAVGRDQAAALRGHPHLPYGAQPLHAVPRQLVPTLRAYGIDVITHNCEYAGSQYETVYGPGMNLAARRQGFRLQERHEGARAPQRLHRELHGQALRRPCRAAAATCTSACADRKTGRNAFFDAIGGRTASRRSALPSPRACWRMRRR